jgi:hypothetical protein
MPYDGDIKDLNDRPKLSSAAITDICKEARERMSYGLEQEQSNRDNLKADVRFVYEPGAQWPDAIRNARTGPDGSGDPCLEFNQMKQFTNQVVNDMRQKRPGVRVHPDNTQSSKKQAELLQGLIRGIEYNSGAEAVYDTGYLYLVVGSLGAWRVVNEYEDPQSFNQVLRIKAIPDPLSVVNDPDYQKPDASDMNWCFVKEELTEEEFKRKYPKAEPIDFSAKDGANWFTEDKKKVVVADYYRRITTERRLVLMSDGAVGWEDEVPPVEQRPIDQRTGVPVQILARRKSEEITVEWYTIAGGDQIVEIHDWPGQTIPVVLDLGDEIIINGKRVRQGLIRHARDSQALFNFGMTAQAIHLALTPRAPWIIAEGQDEGYKEMWKSANTRNWSALIYKPVALDDGSYAAPPQRTQPSMPDAGWISITNQLTGLLKSTMGGLYENTLGQRGTETSGVAIHAREQQGDNATFHYADNHGRAIALTGKIIVECIPEYYQEANRAVTIIDEEDQPQQAQINQPAVDPNTMRDVIKNNVTTGRFAVAVETGESWATKRKENAAFMADLVRANPNILTVAGDLVMKDIDFEYADELAERMEYLQPPELRQARAAKKAGQDPQMAQMAAQMQQVTQALQQCQQQLQATVGELEMVKKDKSASIAASEGKVQESAAKMENDRERLAIERDLAMIQMMKELATLLVTQRTQAVGLAQTANAALATNDQPGV